MKKIRVFDKKNKRYMIFIGILIAVIISLFTFALVFVIQKNNNKYTIPANYVAYDADKNLIETTKAATLKKKWNRNYYLDYDDNNYNMGKSVVFFNKNTKGLNLYGVFYEIKEKGEVAKTSEYTNIESSLISNFYKIADRKYLIVDSIIQSQELVTSNYLLVDIEKTGYAFYSNDTIHSKTIEPTIIKTSTYLFDVNNETLTFYDDPDEVIDLKKVLGSTNEYKDNSIEDKGVDKDKTADNSQSSNSSSSSNNNQNIQELINSINSNGNIDIEKRTSIIGTTSTSSSITINYIIYDPLNEYQEVYVLVNGNKYSMNKELNSITINQLSPNTNYQLQFQYSYQQDNSVLERNFENINISTKNLDVVVKVDKITRNKIYYKVVTELQNLSYNVVLYYNNQRVSETSSLKYLEFDGTKGIYTIKLENIMLNDVSVEEDIYYKFNY